jgi:hypothetical protein
MLHTLRFSLQNVVYFITLPFLVLVLFEFYTQGVLKFKCKFRCQKVNPAASYPGRQLSGVAWLFLCTFAYRNCTGSFHVLNFSPVCQIHIRNYVNEIPTRCGKSSLFFFVFCSTCFGRYIHPSSGASTVQAGMV